MTVDILLLVLGIWGAVFVYRWLATLRAGRSLGDALPSAYEVFVGLVTDFFDTLGIGSFATTTALFRLRGLVADDLSPGRSTSGTRSRRSRRR